MRRALWGSYAPQWNVGSPFPKLLLVFFTLRSFTWQLLPDASCETIMVCFLIVHIGHRKKHIWMSDCLVGRHDSNLNSYGRIIDLKIWDHVFGHYWADHASWSTSNLKQQKKGFRSSLSCTFSQTSFSKIALIFSTTFPSLSNAVHRLVTITKGSLSCILPEVRETCLLLAVFGVQIQWTAVSIITELFSLVRKLKSTIRF